MSYTYTLPSHSFQRPYDDAIHAILSDDPFDDWHGEAVHVAHDEPPPPASYGGIRRVEDVLRLRRDLTRRQAWELLKLLQLDGAGIEPCHVLAAAEELYGVAANEVWDAYT